MKNIILSLFLIVSTNAIAQSGYLQGTLTDKAGKDTVVYLKERVPLINSEGILSVYTAPEKESKKNIEASKFQNLTFGDDIYIVAFEIEDFSSGKEVILRKMVDGDHELYEYVGDDNELLYFDRYNEKFTLLIENIEKIGSNSVGYKEWLFNNFNPKNKPAIEIAELKYRKNKLSDYYMENNQAPQFLQQEPKVKTVSLALNAAFVSNTLKFSNERISDISGSNYSIGFTTFINVDPIENQHTVIAGVSYNTPFDESSINQDPRTGFRIETTIKTSNVGLKIGYAYNIHTDKIRVSPFVTLEPVYFIGTNSIRNVGISDSQIGVEYFGSTNIDPIAFNFNLGIMTTLFNKGFVTIEYTFGEGYEFKDPVDLGYSNGRISIGLGFIIF